MQRVPRQIQVTPRQSRAGLLKGRLEPLLRGSRGDRAASEDQRGEHDAKGERWRIRGRESELQDRVRREPECQS